jgi:hypothetical protein
MRAQLVVNPNEISSYDTFITPVEPLYLPYSWHKYNFNTSPKTVISIKAWTQLGIKGRASGSRPYIYVY